MGRILDTLAGLRPIPPARTVRPRPAPAFLHPVAASEERADPDRLPEPRSIDEADSQSLIETKPLEEIVSPTVVSADVPYFEVGGPTGATTNTVRPTPGLVVLPKSPAVVAAVSPAPVVPPTPTPVPPTPIAAATVGSPPPPTFVAPPVRPVTSAGDAPCLLSISFQTVPPSLQQLREVTDTISAELIAWHQPDHPISEEYRRLRREIVGHFTPGVRPTILFTGASSRSGTSLTAQNLAIAWAKEGMRVLLIDGNPVRPTVSSRLLIPMQPGLMEILERGTPVHLALHRTAVANLSACPTGLTSVGAEHLNMDRLERVLSGLRERFDAIVIDGPEWQNSLAGRLTELADATYLVARHTEQDATSVSRAHEGLLRQGGRIRGYVLTRR